MVALVGPKPHTIRANDPEYPDFSQSAYEQVSTDIAMLGFDTENGLPQNGTLPIPVSQPNGKIRLTYNFGYDDHVFGYRGTSPLLSTSRIGDPKYHLYRINDQNDLPDSVELPMSTPKTFNLGALPWSADVTQKKEYMMAREGLDKEWSLTDSQANYIKPYDDVPLNPWRRAAMVVGMYYDIEQQDYSNNYVVTFEVDPKNVWRPNANQLISDADEMSVPMEYDATDDHYVMDQADFPIPWSTEAALPRVYDNEGDLVFGSLSDMLYDQWKVTLGKQFPWTGIGYTYDWYYQDPSRWSENEGVGVAEFVVMPSSSDYQVELKIVDVQTTAQWLGASEQFPGVPEPASSLLLGLGLVFLPRAMQRRRRLYRINAKSQSRKVRRMSPPRLGAFAFVLSRPLKTDGAFSGLTQSRKVAKCVE